MRLFFIAIFLLAMSAVSFAAQGAAPKTQPAAPERPAANLAAQPGAILTAEELASLRADVARMQTLIEQMEQNLGSVGSTLTPLKHQFQLEIEAWRIMTNQMEKKLRRAEQRAKAAKP